MTVENESLNGRSNDSSSVRVVKLLHLVVKIAIFPHRNGHKSLGPTLPGRFTVRLITS